MPGPHLLRTAQAWQAYLDDLRTKHAEDQQLKENRNAGITKKLEADRLAAVADSLRNDLADFAGAGMQSGESYAAAYQRATDRLGIVAAILAEGFSLEAESEGIIKGRDAEVANLLEKIKIDRAACLL